MTVERRNDSTFGAASFWEGRLDRDFSLKGVGFRRLGLNFNRWMYEVRKDVFLETIAATGLSVTDAEVLDVGCGTGFYLDRWAELGARSISGIDITATAIARLKAEHPNADLSTGDVGEPVSPLPGGSYDAVSAMDVLFHIVDDARFANAIANIAAALKPGGLFIWSDYFIRGREWRIEHQACRSLDHIERVLDDAGFEILGRRPMFYLMANPLDAGRLARASWYAAAAIISLSEKLGDFAGRKLYPHEKRLLASKTEGPSTEIMICRRH